MAFSKEDRERLNALEADRRRRAAYIHGLAYPDEAQPAIQSLGALIKERRRDRGGTRRGK